MKYSNPNPNLHIWHFHQQIKILTILLKRALDEGHKERQTELNLEIIELSNYILTRKANESN